MNNVILKGIIKNIQYSHKISDTEYYKADIITVNNFGKEYINSLKFKKFNNIYKEDQYIEITGNVRSYSKQLDSGKNKVDIYVNTYFDKPDSNILENNFIEISGRLCKIGDIIINKNDKESIHFIIANNIETDSGKKINSYIPCTAFGLMAKKIKTLSVGEMIELSGELKSREYKKILPNNEIEIRIAHEIAVKEFIIL